jgi:hypothetical protein
MQEGLSLGVDRMNISTSVNQGFKNWKRSTSLSSDVKRTILERIHGYDIDSTKLGRYKSIQEIRMDNCCKLLMEARRGMTPTRL